MPEFLCSAENVKHFMQTKVYKELNRQYDGWREEIFDYLENQTDINEILRVQGELKMLKKLKAFPEILLQIIEEYNETLNKGDE